MVRRPWRWCALICAAFLALLWIRLHIPSKIYFDELHYVKAARVLLTMERPQNPEHPLVGKELIALKDPDGKQFVKERVDLARAKGRFWHDYKFTDPLTRKILPKSTYCERVEATAVCVGIYKR